ncbi:radical SAM protein [bacterium]|nr:radical SAM protein [bacterium]
MTGVKEIGMRPTKVNWINFHKACRMAQVNNITSVLLTGKGEPTLFPDQITDYLQHLQKYDFPILELQTNGILFSEQSEKYDKYLKEWYELGLSIISISVVHYDPEKNRANYVPGKKTYPDLGKLIDKLHKIGYSVRFSVVLIKDHIDTPKEAQKMVETANKWGVEQVSLRPVAAPEESESEKYKADTLNLMLTAKKISDINRWAEKHGRLLLSYGHNSRIFDIDGQNVCLTDALTIKPGTDDIRQMIFFPDGHIRFDWQYKGAIIL